MLIEDAADNEALAVGLSPYLGCDAKAGQENQRDKVAVLPLSPCCHPHLSRVAACAKIALVGHEDRLERGRGVGWWAGPTASAVASVYPPPPSSSSILDLFVEHLTI